MFKKIASLLTFASITLTSLNVEAFDDPPVPVIVGIGIEAGLLDVLVMDALHEGSHVFVASSFGAKITEFNLTPKPHYGAYRFGETKWVGTLSPNQSALIYFAPKITDVVILGTYATLLETDSLPKSRLGQLPVLIIATGAWVDFFKDTFSTNTTNDTVVAYNLLNFRTESQRLPLRLAQATVSVATGIELFRGYYKMFNKEDLHVTDTSFMFFPPGYVGWMKQW